MCSTLPPFRCAIHLVNQAPSASLRELQRRGASPSLQALDLRSSAGERYSSAAICSKQNSTADASRRHAESRGASTRHCTTRQSLLHSSCCMAAHYLVVGRKGQAVYRYLTKPMALAYLRGRPDSIARGKRGRMSSKRRCSQRRQQQLQHSICSQGAGSVRNA